MSDSSHPVAGMGFADVLREVERIAGIGSWTRGPTIADAWASPGFRVMLGIADGEVITRESLYELIHPDDRPAVFESTARTFAEGVRFSGRVRAVTRSGRELVIEMCVERWSRPSDGAPVIVGTMRDITVEARRHDRLASAARLEAAGRLAAGLAHELNNVLTVLTGHAELLRTSARSTELESVDAIEAATDRARALTQHLVALGQRDLLRPALVDVAAVVERTVDVTRTAAPAGIRVSATVEPSLPPVHVDPIKLDQILFNLIFNALDAVGESGEVEITARTELIADDRWITIEVIDDGPGMAPHVLERALEPFFTTKAAGDGTGLGLPTSYGLVTQSGGRFDIDSAVGRGTIVTVRLPAAAPTAAGTDEHPHTSTGLSRRATILLAEDDGQLLPLVERLLAGRGHRVLPASDGEEAMLVASRSPAQIDLLVTDVSMPRRNGHELAAGLTAVYPDLRVLYMSGYTDEPAVVDGVATNRIHFIAKPFTLDQLATKVDEVLSLPR